MEVATNRRHDKMNNSSSTPSTALSTTGNNDLAHISADLSSNNATEGTQRDLAIKLRELDDQSKRFLGTAFMRQGDKRLIKELDNARAEAARLILGAQNAGLQVKGETMVRYVKAMANCHLSVLESSNQLNMDGHFLHTKQEMLERLEETELNFTALIARKEERLKTAPEMLKPALVQEAQTFIVSYLDDNKAILADYSEVRKKRFK